MDSEFSHYSIKLTIVGPSGSGKTALLSAYTSSVFVHVRCSFDSSATMKSAVLFVVGRAVDECVCVCDCVYVSVSVIVCVCVCVCVCV